jgi:prepilin-type N-terminal cleavage/methylation domain-containing protein
MKTISTQKGFTLVETLVAIFVLTLSITGPLFIAQQSFTSAATARDRTTASFLAQEGAEYIRSVRDHNYLSGQGWLTGLSACIGSNKACTIDPIGTYPLIGLCTNGSCPPLQKTSDGVFGYQSGTEETKFVRTITITEDGILDGDGLPAEVLVEVKVTWSNKGAVRTTTVQERLYNWL